MVQMAGDMLKKAVANSDSEFIFKRGAK